ncbi:right-handed parallel beta-helix repeat-containing protein [Streptomyces sp. NPDC001046]|uniref:right-handed parallel beta-helix repeat-containing protein n=1 Tax=Streptomyces sp. NPDC001046 TaxID=3364543 RepID=UPI00368B026F
MALLLLAALLTTAPSATAAPGAYYVSSSMGSDTYDGRSASRPFKTIQKAADQTLPGDTVYIMNGTYRDVTPEGVVQVTRSGAPGKPITYRPLPGHKPVIAPVTGWNGIVLIGASYITITGLDIRGDSDNLRLEDAEVGSKPTGPAFNTNCIYIREDSASGRTSHHVTVRNNHIWDCPGAGVGSTYADHLLIEHNRVHSNAWYSAFATSGISVLTPVDVDDKPGYKIIIRKNVVHDNESKVKWYVCSCYSDGNGIIVDQTLHRGGTGTPYKGRILVENNLAFDNGGSGIHSFSSANVDIVHNTAYMNSRGREINYPNIGAWHSSNVRLLNNISVARPGKPTNFTFENTDVVYDYNIYYGGTAPMVRGPHDVIADPRLVAPGTDSRHADFRLAAGSPAIDSGVATSTRTDHAGTPRPLGTGWDRGAYEFRRHYTKH